MSPLPLSAVQSSLAVGLRAGSLASAVPSVRLQAVGRAATAALYDELALEPKPGLVSFVDRGSHDDMDGSTFLRSLFALRHYFVQMAAAGAAEAGFAELEALGLAAEARMLKATAGVNTHRGAVFTLGLLCVSAGDLSARAAVLTPQSIRQSLLDRWGAALSERAVCLRDSNGQRAARRHGLRSVSEEAALGFPVLFEVALPALRSAHALGERRARLQALFHIMATLDDTNLAHRGGLEGLRYAQRAAHDYLQAGGAAQPDGIERARAIHAAFVSRRLSPGGAADLLAAACLLDRLCRRP